MMIKESEKRGKYLDFTKELQRLMNMRVAVIPIVVGTLRTIPKALKSDWKNIIIIIIINIIYFFKSFSNQREEMVSH